MKTALVLISLSSLYFINGAPLKRTRGPKTSTTTEAGFIAKYFHLPEFLKFYPHNANTTEQPINTVELPTKSRFAKILDSINIFKKSKQLNEPYLRAYPQPNGSYKWYFVYPGQMLYPAPDQFSLDALQKITIPTTKPTTTTTTTTEPPSEDDTPKPLYPLMGKIEFVKNGTEPKENEWAITISDSGPIFQPFGEIRPPFDEPLLQQFHSDQDDQQPQEEPEEENESVTRRKQKKHSKPVEQEESPEQQPDEEQAPDEQQEEIPEDAAAYDNAETEQNERSSDENTPEEEDGADDEDQVADDDDEPPAETKAKSP